MIRCSGCGDGSGPFLYDDRVLVCEGCAPRRGRDHSAAATPIAARIRENAGRQGSAVADHAVTRSALDSRCGAES